MFLFVIYTWTDAQKTKKKISLELNILPFCLVETEH